MPPGHVPSSRRCRARRRSTCAASCRSRSTARASSRGCVARQGRALFAYLALHRERLVRRDELEDVLWDGRRPGTADALAPPLSRLRSAVGAERLRGRHELQLELGEDVWIDVEAAWSAVRGARSALDAGAAAEALASARAAEEILAAGLLPGLEGSWLDVERERIRDLRADALELIARAAAAAGGEALPAGETARARRPDWRRSGSPAGSRCSASWPRAATWPRPTGRSRPPACCCATSSACRPARICSPRTTRWRPVTGPAPRPPRCRCRSSRSSGATPRSRRWTRCSTAPGS